MFYPGRVGIHEGVYLGRPGVLGNPFPMTGEHTRHEVCEQFKAWFDRKIEEGDDGVLHELRKLWRVHQKQGPDLRLLCFCHPKECHTETVCNFLNKHLSEISQND